MAFDLPADAASQAEAMLGDGVQLSDTAPAPTPTETPTPEATEAPAPVADNTLDWSLDGVDISKLQEILNPTELAALKSGVLRQADYTRKTQEVSEQRKALGDLDPVQARQAVEFVGRFENEPDFRKEVIDFLAEQEQASTTPTGTRLDGGNDSELAKKVAELETKLQTREEQEQAFELERAWEQYIEKGKADVLKLHPEYSADDIDDVLRFAGAHDWNMLKGAEDYEAYNNRVINRWAKAKDGVSKYLAPSGGTIPNESKKITWDNAESAATEYVRRAEG